MSKNGILFGCAIIVVFIAAFVLLSACSQAAEAASPSSSKNSAQADPFSEKGRKAGDRATVVVNNWTFAFRWCPPETDANGASESNKDSEQKDSVQGFWIMETEVTIGMFREFVKETGYESKGIVPYAASNSSTSSDNGNFYPSDRVSWDNPGYGWNDGFPVTCVSWDDAMEFCKWLESKIGKRILLPTEKQWVYACKAGADSITVNNLENIAWYWLNSERSAHPTTRKQPNAWGLYDMYGNAWEWCLDDLENEMRIRRGGGFGTNADTCRIASRYYSKQNYRCTDVGFRCVIPPKPEPVDFGTGTQAGERKLCTINGVEFAFRWCPPGTFTMGSPESERDRKSDETQHRVTLTKGFWMMETEVSQGQWKAIMGNNPNQWEVNDDDRKPVQNVTWNGCQLFCQKCTALGLPIQLPTEAQWEYACRAGTTGMYAGDLDEMAWWQGHSFSTYNSFQKEISRIRLKMPNEWGLYDMHGNVYELCSDWYSSYPQESVTDPEGPASGKHLIMRGGAALSNKASCRSANRGKCLSDFKSFFLGFRCVVGKGVPETFVPNPVKPKSKVTRIGKFGKGTKAGDRKIAVINGVEFAFRWCPPGTFMMGSPESEKGRNEKEKQHQVTLTRGFWMMETEITQEQWETVMENNPSCYQGHKLPVECVCWTDCQEFISKCSAFGLHLQLPTEAQWEYACRAGTEEAFAGALEEIAWYSDNSNERTHPVGKKKPNAWGLFDMHGNVNEYCLDWLGDYPAGNVTDPIGGSTESSRVYRGGCCQSGKEFCRSAHRSGTSTDFMDSSNGFRCILTSDSELSRSKTTAPVKSGKKNETAIQNNNEGKLIAGTRKVVTVNDVEFAFRYCPPGVFAMGSPESEKGRYNDEIQHQVTITKGFWIMETEISQKQWKAIMGYDISRFKDDDLPVECIDWGNCLIFCMRCHDKGMPVLLPTEAQWEYACRAGTSEPYAGNLDEMAWYSLNSGGKTHPVGTKKPNAWGVYDMHGNVSEFCQDPVGSLSAKSEIDPVGPSSSLYFMARGGSWQSIAGDCRSTCRDHYEMGSRGSHVGFRCIMFNDTEETSYSKTIVTGSTGENSEIRNNNNDNKDAGKRKVLNINGVEFAFRYCPPGTFMMGSPESEKGRKENETQHQVTLTKGFWMMETEVTQQQWIAIMRNRRGTFGNPRFPVEGVGWDDCQEFCKKCSQFGLPVQLPTEAQWEYACRAGTTGAYAGNLDEIAWYRDNSGCRTHAVGSKKPNAWGLYDMIGNVWEWCQDVLDDYPSGSVTDPTGPENGDTRVYRGCCWTGFAQYCRSAYRDGFYYTCGTFFFGFRCVINQEELDMAP